MTNKYAEGLPRKRYYGGCEFVDIAEEQAIARVKLLFGAEHANVQPALRRLREPRRLLRGLEAGRHAAGHEPGPRRPPHARAPGVAHRPDLEVGAVRRAPEDGRVDYDQVEKLAKEHRPRILVAGASAYPRIFDFERFAAIAREVGATLVVDMAHIAGLVAAGLHPSPVPHAELVTSTTHKTLRGPRGGFVLSTAALAEKLDKAVFPGLQGGPLMHIIAAKAVCFGEALTEGFGHYQRRVVGERAHAGRCAGRTRLRSGHRRDRQPPHAGGPARPRDDRQSGGGGAPSRAHHGEQECGAQRSAETVGDERDPHRHARAHHARLRDARRC
jgi:glycine hydroxymethyltransferase